MSNRDSSRASFSKGALFSVACCTIRANWVGCRPEVQRCSSASSSTASCDLHATTPWWAATGNSGGGKTSVLRAPPTCYGQAFNLLGLSADPPRLLTAAAGLALQKAHLQPAPPPHVAAPAQHAAWPAPSQRQLRRAAGPVLPQNRSAGRVSQAGKRMSPLPNLASIKAGANVRGSRNPPEGSPGSSRMRCNQRSA